MLRRLATLGPLLAALAGCAAPTGEGAETATDTTHGALGLTEAEAAGILAVVNYPGTTVATLDAAAGLDKRAAQNIIAHRDGADGLPLTSDDDPYDGISELAAIKYVGDVALSKLSAFASAHPAPSGEIVEGVELSGWQREAVVFGVDHATESELLSLGLSALAAKNLMAAAPFVSVTAMGKVAYVGPAMLSKLRGHAAVWWNAMHGVGAPKGMGGTYDDVSFDDATAKIALEIASLATYEQLTLDAKLTSTNAKRVVESRPYTTLAQLSGVYGIGTATMQALADYARSGKWSAPSTVCTVTFGSASVPAAADFASKLVSTDPRDGFYKYVGAQRSVPTCFDPKNTGHLDALHALVIELADWKRFTDERPDLIEWGAPTAGTAPFMTMVDSSVSHMKELLEEPLAAGDAKAKAQIDALTTSRDALAALVALHPGKTFSISVRAEASECSERAAVFVDLASGFFLLLHQPAQC